MSRSSELLILAGIAAFTIGCYEAWHPLAWLFLGIVGTGLGVLTHEPGEQP